MKKKILTLKLSFYLLLLLAAMHTFFILIGGPVFPDTEEFNQMREYMRTIQIDSGGGIYRTMQNFIDGFNIIVSIFLISLPLLSLLLIGEIKENRKAIKKLTLINLAAVFAFFLTSLSLLSIGGTIISAVACILFVGSLFIKK